MSGGRPRDGVGRRHGDQARGDGPTLHCTLGSFVSPIKLGNTPSEMTARKKGVRGPRPVCATQGGEGHFGLQEKRKGHLPRSTGQGATGNTRKRSELKGSSLHLGCSQWRNRSLLFWSKTWRIVPMTFFPGEDAVFRSVGDKKRLAWVESSCSGSQNPGRKGWGEQTSAPLIGTNYPR